jgi:uncharacterized protein YyaL (SSP411 family)
MNRLARERSPYLLQHAANPVDWYPWGEEAFARARAEDKPIFLSIGYSTCHWCHVMEHESFMSGAIADALNRNFVSIKVDREERPDVDRVYMAFVQATTGSGGWPMTVFLTPALKPFYGGTYFPPTSRWGRPGFLDLLDELARVWNEDRPRVNHAAGELFDRLQLVTASRGAAGSEAVIADEESLDVAIEQFQMAFDTRHGGFGEAPKFPRPAELLFLLREHARRQTGGRGTQAPLLMATETLRAMALGGMRDHIGGGFHRYSVDAEWRVPHFEKMLYDQAQLTLAYLEGGQASGDSFFLDVAADTLRYVLRDMTDPAGGFYSAEDADSIPPEEAADPAASHAAGAEKKEGAFYVWTDAEVAALVGPDIDIVRRGFGLESAGNAPHDPHGEFTGRNLLYVAEPVHDIAIRTKRSESEVAEILARARAAMFSARQRRPRPHLDDKVLTAWNGLMIAAFARGARVLAGRDGASEFLAAAQRAAGFIRMTLWNPKSRQLLRRYRDGDAGIAAYAEDHAYLIFGLLELFQADGDPAWLEWAVDLQSVQDERFWDPADGGWFSTTGDDPDVLLRLKEEYDGAEPSVGAVSALNLLTLSHLMPSDDRSAKAERMLARLGPRIGAAARAAPMMLCALSAWHAGFSQIVVVGRRNEAPALELERALATHYLPFAIHVPVTPGASQDALAARLDFIRGLTPGDGAAAYVCQNFTCNRPVTRAEELRDLLNATIR